MRPITIRLGLAAGAALLCTALLGSPAISQTVGYYTDFVPGDSGPVAAITANGLTPVAIDNIGTFNLNSVNILFIDTVSGGLSIGLTSRESDIAAFVQNGGRLVVNDAAVTDNGILPGGPGVRLTQLGLFDPAAASVSIVTASPLTNGPFGRLTGIDLSNGNNSVNGYADASTLPVGAVNLLSDGDPIQSIAFDYHYGLGTVLYTTVPLDFYFNSPFANDPPKTNFVNVFAPNSLYLASVPEPGVVPALLACGLTGGSFMLRRYRRQITVSGSD